MKKSIFLFWRCFNIKQEQLINEQIRAKEVQVISENGEKLGTMDTRKAIDIAFEKIWI